MHHKFEHWPVRLFLGLLCSVIGLGNSVHSEEPIRVLFIGKEPDHPYGSHMYLHVGQVLAKCVQKQGRVETNVVNRWPKNNAELQGLDTIVIYTSPAAELMLDGPHREEFLKQMRKGVGLVTIHWASTVRKENFERLGPTWMNILGGTWISNVGLSTGPSRLVQLQPKHPICRGWTEAPFRDEFYLNPRLGEQAVPLAQVTTKGQPVTVAWCFERPNGGRSFATTLGHFYDNFQRDDFRRMLVNAILWTAHRDVPAGGADVALSADSLALPPKPPKK